MHTFKIITLIRSFTFILCYLPYWLTAFNITDHHYEINTMAAFNNTSSIDNSEYLSGIRLGGSIFFYTNKNKDLVLKIPSYGLIEIGADTNLTYIKTNRSKQDKVHFAKSVTVLSGTLLVRWYPSFEWSKRIKPFLELGTGPGYMSNKDFEGRDLGMKFTFQDIGGIGIKMQDLNLLFGIYALHYSNAGLSKGNRGVTIPINFKISYLI